MTPPVREKEDKEALLQAVMDGTVDFLATDHAPHSIEEKENGTSGIPHLDTYGLFVTWLIQEKKIPLQKIAEICAKNPGDFVNPYLPGKFGKGFGQIITGFSANFTILDLNKKTTVTREMLKSKSGWSPFEGITFPGSIVDVWFAGKIIL